MDNPTYAKLHAIYREWMAADAAMQAALVRRFGRHACDRRYDLDKSKWPADALAAESEFMRLQGEYFAESRRLRGAV